MWTGEGVDSAETLPSLTLPHEEGRGGNRERGALCSNYFSFFPLDKDVQTCF